LTEAEETAWEQARAMISKQIMESDIEDLFEIKETAEPAPQKARILSSLICEICDEPFMESRSRRFQEKNLCIPCFDNLEKKY
jgi:formylmethanofuran dehydrogenase subunit E